MDRRGVSPLVATLILIALSALLGAIVMSWGKAYIEERAEFVQARAEQPLAGCQGVDLHFIEVSGEPQVCASQNTAKIFVEAGRRARVDNVQVRLVGAEDIFVEEAALQSPLEQGQARNLEVAYEDIGAVRQIRVTPYVGVGESRTLCDPLTVDAPIQVC